MWRSCRKKPAATGRLQGSLCKKHAQGLLSTAGVLQGGPQRNQELPLIFQLGGGSWHIA